jgi:hypothetical protein
MTVPGRGLGVFWTLPWFVAQHAGFFDVYGANVDVKALGPGVDGFRAVQTGDAQFGSWTTQGLANGVANIDPSVRIFHGLSTSSWVLATSDPGLSRCEDMAGQRDVAVDAVGGARYLVLQEILLNCGLAIDSVTTVDFGATVIVESMAAERITTAIMHLDEQARIEAALGRPLTVLTRYADVVERQHFVGVYIQEPTMVENRENLVRALAAVLEATRFMYDPANEEVVAKIAMEYTTIGDDLNTAIGALRTYVGNDFWGVDQANMNPADINAVVAGQIAVGDIEPAKARFANEFVITDIFEEAYERMVARAGR